MKNNPLEVDPRYKRAALRGIWFGAAFAVACIVLAILSARGIAGRSEDISLLIEMAGIGGIVSVGGIAIIKWMRI